MPVRIVDRFSRFRELFTHARKGLPKISKFFQLLTWSFSAVFVYYGTMAGTTSPLWESTNPSALVDECDLVYHHTCHTLYHKQKEVQVVSLDIFTNKWITRKFRQLLSPIVSHIVVSTSVYQAGIVSDNQNSPQRILQNSLRLPYAANAMVIGYLRS